MIKALASCLVVNSHFDGIWPIRALTTGGALCNCLFFASAGFRWKYQARVFTLVFKRIGKNILCSLDSYHN